MMSVIIKTFCYYNMNVTLILSLLFLIRGHNYPGGGFIGALVALTGIGCYTIVYENPPSFLRKIHVELISIGAFFLLLSSIIALAYNFNFLTGIWWELNIGGYHFKLGTPLLFDIGIYLSILGSLNWIITYLESKKYD